MSAVEAALISEEAEAATGSTEPTQGDVPPNIGSEGLNAAKEFVSQVSTFSLATQLDSANAFEEEISLAADLVTSDLDVTSEALASATAAIAEAVGAVLENESEDPLTTYTNPINKLIKTYQWTSSNYTLLLMVIILPFFLIRPMINTQTKER